MLAELLDDKSVQLFIEPGHPRYEELAASTGAEPGSVLEVVLREGHPKFAGIAEALRYGANWQDQPRGQPKNKGQWRKKDFGDAQTSAWAEYQKAKRKYKTKAGQVDVPSEVMEARNKWLESLVKEEEDEFVPADEIHVVEPEKINAAAAEVVEKPYEAPTVLDYLAKYSGYNFFRDYILPSTSATKNPLYKAVGLDKLMASAPLYSLIRGDVLWSLAAALKQRLFGTYVLGGFHLIQIPNDLASIAVGAMDLLATGGAVGAGSLAVGLFAGVINTFAFLVNLGVNLRVRKTIDKVEKRAAEQAVEDSADDLQELSEVKKYLREGVLLRYRAEPVVPAPVAEPKVIELPDVAQETNWDCGAAATMSVAGYFGVGPESLQEWRRLLGTTREVSTNPDRVAEALVGLGLKAEARRRMTLEDLQACFERGEPVLCLVQEYGVETKEQPYGHWVAVVGVGMGVVIVQDPSIDNVIEADSETAQAPGLSVILQRVWNEIWWSEELGVRYERFGIAVSGERRVQSLKRYQREPRVEDLGVPTHGATVPAVSVLEYLMASSSGQFGAATEELVLRYTAVLEGGR